MRNLIAVLFTAALLFACGTKPDPTPPNPPQPPQPPVVTTFEVKGQHIEVKGEMKPGAKPTAGEMKAAVGVAVKQLESQSSSLK